MQRISPFVLTLNVDIADVVVVGYIFGSEIFRGAQKHMKWKDYAESSSLNNDGGSGAIKVMFRKNKKKTFKCYWLMAII